MKTLLDEEIKVLFDELSNLEAGSKEYADIEDNLTKLLDRRIEIEKLETSGAQAEKQMKEDRKARIVKHLIDVGAIALPLAVTIWGTILSFTFEERGTITSSMGRKFMDKLMYKK